MSAARPGIAVCDVGLKGLAVDSGLPRNVQALDASDEHVFAYIAANDEHGMLDAQLARYDDADVLLGTRILLPPGHCDPTVNLYDEYLCHRNGRVVDMWPIDARGLSR
jgi:D-serine deaminase-like pyridoxal phosphate-dependent protein